MEEQILQTSYRLFTTQGIQHYTMDDITARLAISKKTLYRFFESRLHLVQQVCKRVAENYGLAMEEVDQQVTGTLQKLLGYMHVNLRFCKNTNPAFFTDLEKHYPAESTTLVNTVNGHIHNKMLKILEKGIVEGLIRGSLHPQLVVAILQQHSRKDFEFAAELVNDYSKDEVFRQAMYLFLYGIISPQAIPLLEQELNRCTAAYPAHVQQTNQHNSVNRI